MSIRYHPRTPRRQNGVGWTLTMGFPLWRDMRGRYADR